MRVLFICTPYPLEEFPMPPLSLSYLAAVLQREGIEVQILDLLISQHTSAKIRRKLEEYQPRVVGVPCSTMNYPAAINILKVCKGFDPDVVTVIGGPHVSFTATETLEQAPWVDIVVRGEGEETLVEMVRVLETGASLQQVRGIAFRQDGAVVMTEPRPPIEDLDSLPLPARHLLPLSGYRALGAPCSVISSRGCPFGCIFCSAPRMFGRRVRFRDPRLVVDEMEMIHRQFGFDRINIVDDTFTVNHRHVREICNELMRRSLNIRWTAYSRVDTLNQELVEMMKQAGCIWLCFGIESGSEKILKTIKKGITLDDARRGVKLATEAGIEVLASFILGLPGETLETVRQSVDFARELGNDYGAGYGLHVLAPLPGTEVYEEADEYGIVLLTRDWARFDANQPVAETTAMKAEELWECKARYDGTVSSVWEEMKRLVEAGDPRYRQVLEDNFSTEFVWRLVKGDVIEKLRPIRASDPSHAEEELASRVSQRLDIPLNLARQEVGKLVQQGLLKHEQGKGGLIWKWS